MINLAVILKGIEYIRFLQGISAPVLLGVGLLLLGWAYVQAGGFGPMLSAPSRFTSFPEFLKFLRDDPQCRYDLFLDLAGVDNLKIKFTGMYRRDVKPYLDHVRNDSRYESREYDFDFDCMEVSIFRG